MSSLITIRDKNEVIKRLTALEGYHLAAAAEAAGLRETLTGGVSTPASQKSPAQKAIAKRNRQLKSH
jgi:hypothetical protein